MARWLRQSGLLWAVAALFMLAFSPGVGWAANTIIDNFSTDQACLRPGLIPGGPTVAASSTADGAGILGGERDIAMTASLASGAYPTNQFMVCVGDDATYGPDRFDTLTQIQTAGTFTIQWDGNDGDPNTVNPTGLGAVDLTSGGTKNAFILVAASTNPNPPTLTLDVYTDAGNVSRRTLTLALTYGNDTQNFIIPFADFAASQGAGADFTRVGAIVMSATGPTGNAPALSVTEFRTTDTVRPVLSLPGDITQEAADASGAAVSFTVTANDAADGAITPSCTRASGSTFPIGTTTVTCAATDLEGNRASGSFRVTVQDTMAPSLTLPGDIAVEAIGSAGAVVTFAATATDLVDGARTVSCTPASGNTFAIATTTVNCSASDSRGNTATGSFAVTVRDTTAPSITVDVPVDGATYTAGQVVTASYRCADTASPLTLCAGPVASGGALDTATVGSHTFTVQARDGAGNTASRTVTYRVAYGFRGFFQPVDNPPTVNEVNAGRSVPIKFTLSGNHGLDIFASGYPQSQQISCSTSAPVNAVEETVTAGASSLSYDATTDQYIYVWKTDASWAGTCRKLVVRLEDGSEHFALFRFK